METLSETIEFVINSWREGGGVFFLAFYSCLLVPLAAVVLIGVGIFAIRRGRCASGVTTIIAALVAFAFFAWGLHMSFKTSGPAAGIYMLFYHPPFTFVAFLIAKGILYPVGRLVVFIKGRESG